MQLIEIFKEGGFIMYPLLAFSIAIWVIAIQKILFLTKFKKENDKILKDVAFIIDNNKTEDLNYAYKNTPDYITKAHHALFDAAPSREDYEERLHRRIGEVNLKLKQHMWMLGTIASSAPFVGLFGTVWGIMESFKKIGASGKAGFNVVAGSISEALIATGAGILVAVIAVMIYNYLNTKIANTATNFKYSLGDLADKFNANGAKH